MDKPFTVMNVTAIVRSRKDMRRVSSHRLYNTQLYLISLYIYIYTDDWLNCDEITYGQRISHRKHQIFSI